MFPNFLSIFLITLWSVILLSVTLSTSVRIVEEVSSGRVFGEQRSDPLHEKMDRCQDTVLFDNIGSVSGEPDGMHITRSRIRVLLRVKVR